MALDVEGIVNGGSQRLPKMIRSIACPIIDSHAGAKVADRCL
jgi:hypothetical protein